MLLVAGMWAAPVSAEETYVSAFAGHADMNHVGRGHNSSAIAMLGAIGLAFENDCRLEAEVGNQTVGNNGEYGSNLDSNMSVISLLANAYYDIPVYDFASPYITAGAGGANINPMGINWQGSLNTSKSTFAFQLGAGITIPIGDNVKLDARYRYFATPKIILDPAFDNKNLSSDNFLLGLRFTF